MIKAVAQTQPAAAVTNLRKTMEDVGRGAGEGIKKNEAQDRADHEAAFKRTDDIRAELNRKTPAQRKLPAIVDPDPTRTEWLATGASMLDRDTGANTAHRVLTPTCDFWRAFAALVGQAPGKQAARSRSPLVLGCRGSGGRRGTLSRPRPSTPALAG